MANEEISFKDLNHSELDKLKDIYVSRRLKEMSVEDLTTFTKTVIEDQIKGTVGNEEEREAWKEMKEFLNEDFDPIVNGLKKSNTANSEVLKSPEEQELEKRKELLEKRKMESDQKQEDMW